jgi:hypothetical protein
LPQLGRHQGTPNLLARGLRRLHLRAVPLRLHVVRVERQHHAERQMIGTGHHRGRAGRQQFDEDGLRICRAPVVDDQDADVLDRQRRFGLFRPLDHELAMGDREARARGGDLDRLAKHGTPARTIVTLAVIAGQAKESRLEFQAQRLRPRSASFRGLY